MKHNYEIPEISVILFDNEDIVTTSASITNLWSDNSSDNDIAWDILNK